MSSVLQAVQAAMHLTLTFDIQLLLIISWLLGLGLYKTLHRFSLIFENGVYQDIKTHMSRML